MNARRFIQVGLIVVPVLLPPGCLSPPQVTEDTPTVKYTLFPTIKPAATSESTATPRLTRTPTPSLTPLPFPTLEPDAMHAFIVEMLATNGGCELPCWWSITPGETRWDDMIRFFNDRSIWVGESGWLDLKYQTGWYGDRLVYDSMMEVTFRREGDVVQGVVVRDNPQYAPLQDDFAASWQRYALQPVLSRLGVPSQVYLNLTIGAPCVGSGIFPDYGMWVVYESQGAAIRYAGLALRDNERWLVCPVFGQLEMIEIRLQATDADTELVDLSSEVFDGRIQNLGEYRQSRPRRSPDGLLGAKKLLQPTHFGQEKHRIDLRGLLVPQLLDAPVFDPDGTFSIYGPLPDLSEMSMQAFYDAFSQPEPGICVAVPHTDPGYDEIVLPPDPQVLSLEAEDALLVEMLATNGGCELPCWWGITPGVTRWEDAQRLFLFLQQEHLFLVLGCCRVGNGA
jgi:hypothetical protein